MALSLQYQTTAQRAWVQTTSARNYHPFARKADHELTFKSDQSDGAGHFHSGDYRGALNVLRENLAMGGPYGPHMMVYQAACYSALGQHQEERATLELLKQAITAPGAFSVEGWLRRASSRERYMKPLIDELVKARRLR